MKFPFGNNQNQSAAGTPVSGGSTTGTGAAAPAPATGTFREFIAEVDCIYRGRYVTAGTRVTAEAERIPHFRRA
ncbi:MAG: hypothetical protein LBQ14_07925 [Treponema sp.]|jgi:hypothetical protein|nr:hypothetical protein [Treponema sp.]